MKTGIKGRCALVNGASAGMGRAAAESLAAEGVEAAKPAGRVFQHPLFFH